MAVTRASNSGITTGTLKYESMLAGRLALPSVPTIGTATAGDAEASVTFTPGSITGSTYTMLSTPGSITASGAASPIVITGLTNDTAYTFQVRANNTTGSSDYSSASNSVTPTVPAAFESIATATGTGSSGVITFSSIPSTFSHLQIRYLGKSTQGGSAARYNVTIQMNGATGSVYSHHYLRGTNSVASAAGTATTTNISLQANIPNSATAYNSMHGIGVIDIIDYASTTKNKTLRATTGSSVNVAAADLIAVGSGLYQATTAVSSITLTVATGSWTTTSVFGLFGIKNQGI